MKILILLFITLNLYSQDFVIIEITTDPAFNHFASIQLWLLIILSPLFLVIGLIRHTKKHIH